LNIGWCFTVFSLEPVFEDIDQIELPTLKCDPRSHISYRNCSRIVGFVGKTYGFSAIRTPL
jgi:hypothetical protein